MPVMSKVGAILNLKDLAAAIDHLLEISEGDHLKYQELQEYFNRLNKFVIGAKAIDANFDAKPVKAVYPEIYNLIRRLDMQYKDMGETSRALHRNLKQLKRQIDDYEQNGSY